MTYTRLKRNDDEWNSFNKDLAITIDKLGNVLLADIFNTYLITKNGYRFGNRKETISSALGKNLLQGTLTSKGLYLVNLLDKIDKNHCIDSIDYNLN